MTRPACAGLKFIAKKSLLTRFPARKWDAFYRPDDKAANGMTGPLCDSDRCDACDCFHFTIRTCIQVGRVKSQAWNFLIFLISDASRADRTRERGRRVRVVDNPICTVEGPVQGGYAPSADWTLSAKMCPLPRLTSRGVRQGPCLVRCNTHVGVAVAMGSIHGRGAARQKPLMGAIWGTTTATKLHSFLLSGP